MKTQAQLIEDAYYASLALEMAGEAAEWAEEGDDPEWSLESQIEAVADAALDDGGDFISDHFQRIHDAAVTLGLIGGTKP